MPCLSDSRGPYTYLGYLCLYAFDRPELRVFRDADWCALARGLRCPKSGLCARPRRIGHGRRHSHRARSLRLLDRHGNSFTDADVLSQRVVPRGVCCSWFHCAIYFEKECDWVTSSLGPLHDPEASRRFWVQDPE